MDFCFERDLDDPRDRQAERERRRREREAWEWEQADMYYAEHFGRSKDDRSNREEIGW